VIFLLQSGHFSASGTYLTSTSLRFYSLGIFAWSAQAILTRGFYALQDSRTPVISGTIMTVVFIGMNWLVIHETNWGVAGLALATSIAATLHMLVMFILLRKRLGGLQDGLLARSILSTLLATAVLCLVSWLLRSVGDAVLPAGMGPKLHAALVLLVSGGSGLVAFWLVARALKMPELASTIGMIRRRSRG
jgi:putative peptidoglycan lipid II flippase